MSCLLCYRLSYLSTTHLSILGLAAFTRLQIPCQPDTHQRRSQDFFFGGGPLFHDLRRPTRIGGGGGVVAGIFRDRHQPATFSGGGGGVVADIFRDRITQITFVREIFWTFSPYLHIFRNLLQKKNIYRKFGGGHGPPGPPPGYATDTHTMLPL